MSMNWNIKNSDVLTEQLRCIEFLTSRIFKVDFTNDGQHGSQHSATITVLQVMSIKSKKSVEKVNYDFLIQLTNFVNQLASKSLTKNVSYNLIQFN